MIYLEPNYGLANRLRVIASGLDLRDKVRKELIIIWPKTFELNCAFGDLFTPISNVTVIDKPLYFHLLKDSDQAGDFKKRMAWLVNKAFNIDYCVKEDEGMVLSQGGAKDAYKTSGLYKSVYIKTCGEFTSDISYYKLFKPVAELQKIIGQRTAAFTSHTIGLHIRRTDNIDSISNSPLELFKDVIEKEYQKNPEVSFYLSTDDPETEKNLKSEFGQIITTYQKDFSRNSLQGMKDALLDMYCLSNTSKIYGSFSSSFSDIASKLSAIPLYIIKAGSNARKPQTA